MDNIAPSQQRNFTSGFKPKQNIPESQKNEDWVKDNIDWCISMLPIFTRDKIDEQYDLFNGKRSQEAYSHITKTYGIEYPAGKMKHVPLIRPMFNELVSELEERNLDFSVYAEDPDSVAEKVNQVSETMLQDIVNAIQTSNTPEELDAEFDKLEQEYRKFQTDVEINAFKLLRNYIERHKLYRELSDNWLDKLISGMEYYRVHLNRLNEDPIYTVIKPGDLFYADNNVRTVAECDWACYITEMSPVEIIDMYGDRMSDDDIKTLEDYLDMYQKDAFYKLRPGETMDSLYHLGPTNTIYSNQKLTMYHVEYKSLREIRYMESPNKYAPEYPFIKYIDDTELYKLTTKKKKLVKKRYVQDLYHGIRIGDAGGIYIDLGKYQFPVRSMAEPSKVRLTFNGYTYNGKIRPYSLLKETRDLQDIYDILHWHKENLIALSGTKGSFMDLSQMPDFGTGKLADNIKMYFYYRKMGASFINRSQEGADRSFNQFQPYDDTLGAGLNAILLMIQHIENTASRITGVSPQRMAQIKPDAGKGTTEMNLNQSSLITEYLFNQHDEMVEYALNDIINALHVAYPEGTSGSFISNDGKSQFYKLDERFPMSDYAVHLTTKKSDSRKVDELKQLSLLMVKQGTMAAQDLFIFFKKDSLPSILQEVEDNINKRSQAQQQMQMQMAQMQQQMESATGQAEIQKLQAQAQELQAKIQNYQAQNDLENKALEVTREAEQAKLDLDAKRVDLEAQQLQLDANSRAAEVRND